MKEFQKQGASLVKAIDRKYGIQRDPHFSFTQLMEEIGELARAINTPKLRNKELDLENLNEEFADVLLQLAVLADIHGVNLEEALSAKMAVLKEKHGV
ncbi:nucleotide pyrophosphohydrolase [Patescibacteria group bacterium]|nr:nucleotide pyrophosphohydrolase [Patescibacteria group bacterium]